MLSPAEIDDRARKVVIDYFEQVRRKTVTVSYETDFARDLGADSLDLIEIVMHLEEAFDVECSDAEAEANKTYGQTVTWLVRQLGAKPDEVDSSDACMACLVPFQDGDLVLNDAGGGALHAACCGPERESYTNGNGDPLGPDDPIPTGYRWTKWPTEAVRA